MFSDSLFLENHLRLANQASSLDGEKKKNFWFTIIGERERERENIVCEFFTKSGGIMGLVSEPGVKPQR